MFSLVYVHSICFQNYAGGDDDEDEDMADEDDEDDEELGDESDSILPFFNASCLR